MKPQQPRATIVPAAGKDLEKNEVTQPTSSLKVKPGAEQTAAGPSGSTKLKPSGGSSAKQSRQSNAGGRTNKRETKIEK